MTAPASVYAGNSSSASAITVNAVVQPHIYIVLNSAGDIDEIYSNSKISVEPLVVTGSLDGQTVEYTGEVAAKYSRLKQKLHYDQGPGVLYKHKQPAKAPDFIKAGSIISLVSHPLARLPF